MIFGFSSVILVMIYWINRAVKLFDWLIASGQSASVFLEFTALTLPNVIRIVLPISGFVAAVYTTNRLVSESELVVVQATGYGPFRLARPVAVFGLFVAAFVMLLVHFAVPVSFARLADRQVEIAENVTAKLLSEGRFIHPDAGVTVYIREVTGRGELQDLYLRDARDPGEVFVYTATHALLARTDSGPRLVLYDGIAQTLDTEEQILSVTRFDEFGTDVSGLIAPDEADDRRTIRELSTRELLTGDPAAAEEVRTSPDRLRVEGHQRFSQPLLSLVAPLIGFATLLLGGFSRFGIWNQIFGAVILVIVVYTLDNAMAGLALARPGGWPLVYLAPLFGLALSAAILWIAGHPHLFRRRRRTA